MIIESVQRKNYKLNLDYIKLYLNYGGENMRENTMDYNEYTFEQACNAAELGLKVICDADSKTVLVTDKG